MSVLEQCLILYSLLFFTLVIAMALINGAHSPASVLAAWKASFIPIMRLTTVISTLSMATAQKFLAPELWVPFFNLIAGVAGTYINVSPKQCLWTFEIFLRWYD